VSDVYFPPHPFFIQFCSLTRSNLKLKSGRAAGGLQIAIGKHIGKDIFSFRPVRTGQTGSLEDLSYNAAVKPV